MQASLFNKSDVDRANAPEELNDYIRVESLSVWIILAAAIVFLIGVVIWGIFGTVGTTLEVCAAVEGDSAVCYVSAQDISELEVGMEVSVGDSKGGVCSIPDAPVRIDADFDEYALYLSGFSRGDYCYAVDVDLTDVKDGIYPAVITLESLHPIFFITH